MGEHRGRWGFPNTPRLDTLNGQTRARNHTLRVFYLLTLIFLIFLISLIFLIFSYSLRCSTHCGSATKTHDVSHGFHFGIFYVFLKVMPGWCNNCGRGEEEVKDYLKAKIPIFKGVF